jgi:hypothetical protein
MAEQEDEETQVGDFLASQAEPPPLPPDIYNLRRDSNAIKVRLLALVNDPEYWRVFSTFVYGQCSKEIFDECMERLLRTPEMRILHNELIRAVLYNAHFAMVPPEGVPTPPPPPPTIKPTPPPRTVTFTTYSAADLRHIPSLAELTRRVSALSDAKKMLIASSIRKSSDTRSGCSRAAWRWSVRRRAGARASPRPCSSTPSLPCGSQGWRCPRTPSRSATTASPCKRSSAISLVYVNEFEKKPIKA